MGIFRLLNENERALLQEQKSITEQSRQLAREVGISTKNFTANPVLEDLATFCVVVAGEYNAGKSTLINALIGKNLLETGSLPTTDAVTVLSHAPAQVQYPGVVHHHVPNLPLLQDLTMVDTPGTNAVLLDHTVKTMRLLPTADLILFVTSADRPFPASERELLASMAEQYRKSIVVVINKMDILEMAGGDHGAAEKQRVVQFVTEHARTWLGVRPTVLAVSAREALAAKLTGRATNASAGWQRSNLAALETFLQETLTTETKIQSKLSSPLGVAEGLLSACLEHLMKERSALENDVITLNLLQTQFSGWHKELSDDMDRARQDFRETLRLEGQRCQILVRRMGIWNVYPWTLLENDRLDREWRKTHPSFHHSTKGIRDDLKEKVAETADSIATKGRAQGQAVIEFLGRRPAVQNQSLIGSVTAASRFEDTRQNLHQSMLLALHQIVPTGFDVDGDSMDVKQTLARLRQLAWTSMTLHLATLCTLLGNAAQPSIYLLASSALIAVSNMILMSFGPKQIARQHSDIWLRSGEDLDQALRSIFSKELDRVTRRIRDGVSPYTRFAESELERLDQLRDRCDNLVISAQNLRNKIYKTKR